MEANLKTIFVETVDPEQVQPGLLIVSERYNCSQHICPCGCGTRAVIPFIPGDSTKDNYWGYTRHEDGTVTFAPSIKNRGCRAHYYIERSQIVRFTVDPQ